MKVIDVMTELRHFIVDSCRAFESVVSEINADSVQRHTRIRKCINRAKSFELKLIRIVAAGHCTSKWSVHGLRVFQSNSDMTTGTRLKISSLTLYYHHRELTTSSNSAKGEKVLEPNKLYSTKVSSTLLVLQKNWREVFRHHV